MEGNRRGKGIYRGESERSNRAIRGRLEKRRENITLKEEDICS